MSTLDYFFRRSFNYPNTNYPFRVGPQGKKWSIRHLKEDKTRFIHKKIMKSSFCVAKNFFSGFRFLFLFKGDLGILLQALEVPFSVPLNWLKWRPFSSFWGYQRGHFRCSNKSISYTKYPLKLTCRRLGNLFWPSKGIFCYLLFQ